MAELKTRLIQLLDLAQSFQRQLIADFPSDSDQRRGTWEQWMLKDELAHVIAWQLNALARMAALIHAEPVPDFSDYERINRAIFDTNRDRTLAEIAAEGDRAQADFVELIRSLPEEDLAQPGRFGDQEKRDRSPNRFWTTALSIPVFHYADFYRRRGELVKGTQVYQASVAALADWPEQYGIARYNLACFYALTRPDRSGPV